MTSVSDKENRLLSITALRNSFTNTLAELLIYNFEPGFKWKILVHSLREFLGKFGRVDFSDFTSDDATDWERRLGMIVSPLVDLDLRKLAIKRKMNHPGDIKSRQHYLYIEGQLRAAGFDVYVYENRFPYGGSYYTRTLFDIIGGVGIDDLQHGDKQHGDSQHGGTYSNIIANYIDETLDSNFAIPSNLRCTFFIGGSPLGQFANVPIERKQEFRQLILKLKPAQMVGYLLINYI